jgi:hypothetical protein
MIVSIFLVELKHRLGVVLGHHKVKCHPNFESFLTTFLCSPFLTYNLSTFTSRVVS